MSTKSPFLHLCHSHAEMHLHLLTLRHINISPNTRSLHIVFLSDCPALRSTYCQRMNHGHLSLPVNEYRATHPLNLSSPLAIFFSSSPLFPIRRGLYSSPPLLSAASSGVFPALFFFLIFRGFFYVLSYSLSSRCPPVFSLFLAPPLCRDVFLKSS